MANDDPIPALKKQLGDELARLLAGWRASDICWQIGTDPARVSDLRRGKLERFSLETLIRFATRLRRRVELVTTVERFKRREPVPRVAASPCRGTGWRRRIPGGRRRRKLRHPSQESLCAVSHKY